MHSINENKMVINNGMLTLSFHDDNHRVVLRNRLRDDV